MKSDNSKTTVLVIVVGFLALHLIFNLKWALTVSFVIGLAGVFSAYLSKKIHWLWMKLSEVLGLIVPNILLSLVYYLVLFPISILFRIFNKDPLMLSKNYDSYFVNVNRNYDKKSFENTW